MSFETLKVAELREAARFFGADDKAKPEIIRAELLETGVTWEMFEQEFRTKVDEEVVVEKPSIVDTVEEVEEVSEVITAPQTAVLPEDQKYLIKMTRKNHLFEVAGHRFTSDKPYAIMTAAQAQHVLQNEEGFRQAFPAELEEFYS